LVDGFKVFREKEKSPKALFRVVYFPLDALFEPSFVAVVLLLCLPASACWAFEPPWVDFVPVFLVVGIVMSPLLPVIGKANLRVLQSKSCVEMTHKCKNCRRKTIVDRQALEHQSKFCADIDLEPMEESDSVVPADLETARIV
jgi:hypothetical protein